MRASAQLVSGNFCEQAYRGRNGHGLRTIQRAYLANLTQIKNQKNVDNPIRLFCSSYIDWIEVTTQFSFSKVRYLKSNLGICQRHGKDRPFRTHVASFFMKVKD